MTAAPPRVRLCARVVLLDAADRLLLLRYHDEAPIDPERPWLVDYWCLPGGGVEAGETFEQAALREVAEETGLDGTVLGPCLARREIDFLDGGEPVRYDEHYFLGRLARHAPPLDLGRQEADERELLQDWRWWPLAELDDCAEPVLPDGIVEVAQSAARGTRGAAVRL